MRPRGRYCSSGAEQSVAHRAARGFLWEPRETEERFVWVPVMLSQKEKFYHRVIGMVLNPDEQASKDLEKLWSNSKDVAGFSGSETYRTYRPACMAFQETAKERARKQREEKAAEEERKRKETAQAAGTSSNGNGEMESGGDVFMDGGGDFEDEEIDSSAMMMGGMEEVVDASGMVEEEEIEVSGGSLPTKRAGVVPIGAPAAKKQRV